MNLHPAANLSLKSSRTRIAILYGFFVMAINASSQVVTNKAGEGSEPEQGLQLHYTFQQVSGSTVADESGNGYHGSLQNGASVNTRDKMPVLNLGFNNGYLDMGSATGTLIASLNDFTVATYLYIDPASSITGNGNFVWAFATHSATTQYSGKYIAYRVNTQRYAESLSGWSGESAVTIGSPAPKGVWQHIVYTQTGTTGVIYLNGQLTKVGNIPVTPSAIGEATGYNWLGRPQFSGDAYLKGASYADFRIYNRALTTTEVQTLAQGLADLNYEADSIAVEQASLALNPEGLDEVRNHLSLPDVVGDNVSVSWSSGEPGYLAADGTVTRPLAGENDAVVNLTATLSRGKYSTSRLFTVTIRARLSDSAAAAYDAHHITLQNDRCFYQGTIHLPATGIEGSTIRWKSSEPDYLTDSGRIIQLNKGGEGARSVALTATVTKGIASSDSVFTLCINEEEPYSAYLFTYFIGNNYAEEQIFFALSEDGYSYKALNEGKAVLSADTISTKKGVRDPHILRGPDGKYYMVATDMRANEANCNWACNSGIVLLKSDDLVNWTHSRVDVATRFPAEFGNVIRAWAPQTYYDQELDKLMVYFSMKTTTSGSYDVIYYAWANADFTDLETVPQVLFDNNVSAIDGDIIYHDNNFHLFFKTEGAADKGYMKAVSQQLTGPYTLLDKYLDQTNDAVEGACVFRLINQDKYILMYDVYTRGRYEFTESDNLEDFTVVNQSVSMDFKPRHGTVMPITAEEATRLKQKWGGLTSGLPSEDTTTDKGELLRTEVYSLSGYRVFSSVALTEGIYIFRKLYSSGSVVHQKRFLRAGETL